MIEALWPSSWRIDARANRTIWGDAGTKVAIVGTALLPVMLVGFTIYVAIFAEFGNVANLYCARRRWKEAKRDLGQHGGHLPPQRMFWYHDISDFLAVLQQEGHIWFTLVSFCILCSTLGLPAGSRCKQYFAILMAIVSSVFFIGVTFINSDTAKCKWIETHNKEFKVQPIMHGVVTNVAFISQIIYLIMHIDMRTDFGFMAWAPLAACLGLIVCPGATSWFFKFPVPNRHIGEWMCVGFVGLWYLVLSVQLCIMRYRFKDSPACETTPFSPSEGRIYSNNVYYQTHSQTV